MRTDPSIQQSLQAAVRQHKAGNFPAAEQLYRQIIQRFPGHADALQLLGALSYQTGKFEQAVDFISQAVAIAPGIADWHNNLGNALKSLNRNTEALAAFQQSVALNPRSAVAQLNLGNMLLALSREDDAIAAYCRAIELKSDFFEARLNLGRLLLGRFEYDPAIKHLELCARLNPRSFDAHQALARAYQKKEFFVSAARHFRQALAIKPDDRAALSGLAAVLASQNPQAAIDVIRHAMDLAPDNDAARSNRLVVLHYHEHEAQSLFAEHVEWDRRHARLLRGRIRTHTNDRNPDRPLRIGYVSPDLREHSVAYFAVSLLAGHDRAAFKIHVFDNNPDPDDFTSSIRGLADRWHEIHALSNEQTADLIRRERIDILVDLTGHFARNRLLVFAQKPAPIQVTYLGYPNTTGLEAIDYRFTDALADPPGKSDALHTETLIRLPQTAWCYHPNPHAPEVTAPPMLASGRPTFASFNNFAKVSPTTLDLWAGVLRAVPDARLVIKAAGLGEPEAQQPVLDAFASRGIDPSRIELMGRDPSTAGHLALYSRCDVALDTYPYHGTTTTCEALWMGVPVVTLAGHSHVARVGASLLTNVGLPELIACDGAEYASIAARLVSDRQRLAELRAGMRARLNESPLLNFRQFARHVETAYRQMWRTFCASDAPVLTSDDHNSLGIDAYSSGRFDEAAAHFHRALAVDPRSHEACNNLGNIHQLRGELDQAIAMFRKSVELRSDIAQSHSNLLLTLHYRVIDPRTLFEEHLEWARRHAEPLSAGINPHANSRDPERRLRIGYVSGDFHEHSVMYFIRDILRAHDRSQFEIHCFDNTQQSDELTKQLKRDVDRWHRIVGMGDDDVAKLIRREQIDILIDLSGHTADNRLLVFARKPAPIQITYQGYPNTTGMRAIDYRLTDAITDPPGQTEQFHTEELIRLPTGAWCFSPSGDAPEVAPVPMLATGHPTFGSFNNFAKVSPDTVELWSSVLRAVPNSSLLIKAAGLTHAPARDNLLRQFGERGIGQQRLQLLGREPSTAGHLRLYGRCDVALDTYPYHGTTTTCEALWMGVPVVTLAGDLHVSRVGASLLTTVGLGELVAASREQFVQIAQQLTNDRARLAELRRSLRDRLRKSPLLDAAGFARHLELEYRKMWRRWCDGRSQC